MQKRGQVTVFVIIGIVIIIAIIMGVVFRQAIFKSSTEAEVSKTTTFTSDTAGVKAYVEDCIGEKLDEAFYNFAGSNIATKEEYLLAVGHFVEDRAKTCLRFSQFSGLNIDIEEPITAEASLDEQMKVLSAIVKFKLNIEKDGKVETISEFHAEKSLTTKVYAAGE